jgi:hypothetical protein
MIVYETIRVSPQEISAKWPKLTLAEAEALKTPEALSAEVVKSYDLPKDQAESDVKTWLAGRTF